MPRRFRDRIEMEVIIMKIYVRDELQGIWNA